MSEPFKECEGCQWRMGIDVMTALDYVLGRYFAWHEIMIREMRCDMCLREEIDCRWIRREDKLQYGKIF